MVEVPTIRWAWDEEHPATQTMVALYGNHFGTEPGQLPTVALAAYMVDLIPGTTEYKATYLLDSDGRAAEEYLTRHYDRFADSDQRTRSILRIGALAGTVACRELAGDVHIRINSQRFLTLPSLRVLSERAVANLRPESA